MVKTRVKIVNRSSLLLPSIYCLEMNFNNSSNSITGNDIFNTANHSSTVNGHI